MDIRGRDATNNEGAFYQRACATATAAIIGAILVMNAQVQKAPQLRRKNMRPAAVEPQAVQELPAPKLVNPQRKPVVKEISVAPKPNLEKPLVQDQNLNPKSANM